MSAMSLNLLPSSAKFQASKIRLQKRIRMVMIWLAGGWLLLLIVAFVTNWVLGMRIQTATAKNKSVTDSYALMSDSILLTQDMKHKAKLVAGVLGNRFEYGQSFKIINVLFDSGINLDKYELGESGVCKVEGSLTTQEGVDRLEEIIEEINAGEREGLSEAVLVSLSTGKSQGWKFVMEVNLR
jgi:hypothetical protein